MTKASKRRKKTYSVDLHTKPYELESNTFDRDKVDPDCDERDLAGLGDLDDPDPLTLLDLSEVGGHSIVTESAELGTDSNDSEDKVSEIGGKARPAPVTRQLVQDAGGYLTEVDPRMLWTTATRFYCRACGEWIGSSPNRLKCEVPLDPCTPEMLKRRGGCQNCREQHALDLKVARGRGNQPQTCRPLSGEKESRCAKDWRNTMARWQRAVNRAERKGTEPPPEPQPAEPKWTARDRRRFRDAEDITAARAEYEQHPPQPPKKQPKGVWGLDARGTGFDARDGLRKPGWR
ncbi:hypothetical protein ACQI4L_26220 [Mycolicibacterium litorale]|uniref:hypothetical protein n=1 Tax=Mycolicibacterium litorale TaxID=758802 RepID=UPI003CE8B044